MALRYDTITFLSDYGLTDEFVGVVHSVIRSIAPEVGRRRPHPRHRTPTTCGRRPGPRPQHARTCAPASWSWRWSIPRWARRAGRSRSRSATARRCWSGPDNGLLAPAVAMCGGATRAVEITDSEYHRLTTEAATFDGRDVFAPAAAHLCLGVDLAELGPPIDPVIAVPGHGAAHPLRRRGACRRGAVGRPLRQRPAQRRPRGARGPRRQRGLAGRWTTAAAPPAGSPRFAARRAQRDRPGRRLPTGWSPSSSTAARPPRSSASPPARRSLIRSPRRGPSPGRSPRPSTSAPAG